MYFPIDIEALTSIEVNLFVLRGIEAAVLKHTT
jgi:hypothetical protein